MKKLSATSKGVVEIVNYDREPLENDKVEIEAYASIVSPGTERAIILNMKNSEGEYPKNFGYSVAGKVVNIGKDVTGFEIGDRVSSFCMPHMEVGSAPARFCKKIPEGVSYEQASLLALGVITMQGVRKARIELGETVMIVGLGPVGLISLALAKLNGAANIIAVDTSAVRLEYAKKMGATHTFEGLTEENIAEIQKIGKGGPSVVIESTGYSAPIIGSFEACAKFARIVMLASTRELTEVNFYKTIHRKALQVLGAHIMGNPDFESRPGYWTWQDDAQAFLTLMQTGRLDLSDIITDRVNLEGAIDIYNKLVNFDSTTILAAIKWKD